MTTEPPTRGGDQDSEPAVPEQSQPAARSTSEDYPLIPLEPDWWISDIVERGE
jgi:hypothetical protein